ncbi:MAG: DNA-directed RNA polymerase subunit beta', partial [Oscillospiraceae bacterium]|nr:DNA-directed RNA polymerase subunit beta' [Oscillospiraceae bacterium]
VREWEKTTKEVTDELTDTLNEYNPVYMMANSGARGSMNQIRQLAGMRGLMANTAGKTIEIPIKANFREGLTVLEYFVSSRGARKGLADTALRTADSGYLTRRLVDVSQDVIVRESDCGTTDGIVVQEIVENGSMVETFAEVLHGRYPTDDIFDKKTGELLFDKNHMLSAADAATLESRGITSLKIRTVMDCESTSGICAKCYGINLATGGTVSIGEAVGVIAAQSIGEPGTQLTMRTFHTGGIAGDDITQGLPRVEELFEARKPKKMAILAEIGGKVEVEETRKNAIVAITITHSEDGDTRIYQTPYSSGIRVKTGDIVTAGDKLTDGALYPADIMRILGKSATQTYIINEVQRVYRQQGVDINDKHIEVIVRQMMRKLKIEEGGDTELLSGTTVDLNDFKVANAAIRERIENGETELMPAQCIPLIMGITKASLATESFLSAASFQETTKVLTEAAIKGKVDRLVGLKENVIIGKLVPAGSGLAIYRKFDSDIDEPENVYDEVSEGDESAEDVDLSQLVNSGNAL